MLQEFREFAARGNAIDLAVGVILGAAFGKIVSSFVNDIIMPPLGLLLGKVDFTNLYVNLSGRSFETLAEAKKAGAPTVNYGVFLNAVIEFLIVAFAVFLLVRQLNRFRSARKPQEELPATKECAFCLSIIALKATRCPHCTSELRAA